MTHVSTRIVEKIPPVSDPELHCNVCEEWKPVDEFRIRGEAARGHTSKDTYETRCLECDRLKTKLWGMGHRLTTEEIRKFLGVALAAAPILNKANHGSTKTAKPLSTKVKEELRERREESEGKPSMCYLVGMEGDRSAVKIGHSTNVYRRMAQYQAGNPRKLVVLSLLPGGETKERELHQKFMCYHSDEFVGEWFTRSPEILNHFAAGKVAA